MRQAKLSKKKEGLRKQLNAINIGLITKMRTHFNAKNNPRVIIIQKLYGKFYNEDKDNVEFPKT